MKREYNFQKIRNIVFVVLGVIFALQLVSRLLFTVASRTESAGLFKAAAYSFPLEPDAFYRYGLSHLDKEMSNVSENNRRSGITAFRKVLARNPFDHRAHFNLARAYLSRKPLPEDTLARGLAGLRRADRLKGGKDLVMSSHTLTLMLMQWKQLSDDEKELCRRLLDKIITRITPETFQSLLGEWEQYSGDTGFFENTLEKAPQYYAPVAAALARLEINMELRRLFLLNHEIYTIEDINHQLNTLSENSPNLLDQLRELRARLLRNIPGYYKLIPGNKFKTNTLRDLLKKLNFHILSRLMPGDQWKTHTGQRETIARHVSDCIADFDTGEDLNDLYQFLERQSFFAVNDRPSLEIKGRLFAAKQDYAAVITHLEQPFSTGAAESKEDIAAETSVMLLLADAYISSRLLTKAMPLLAKVERRAPDRLELHRLRMKVEQTLGPETSADPQRLKYYDRIRRSSAIRLTTPTLETTVILVNNNRLEIHVGDNVKHSLGRNAHLLQVFVDGEIRREAYFSRLEQPVKVDVPAFQRYAKHTVTVKVI